MRYRAEVDYAYDRIGKLIQSGRQHRQLLNRGPLEYEDAIAVAEYVKTLPFVDAARVGYMGMSSRRRDGAQDRVRISGFPRHGGERTGLARFLRFGRMKPLMSIKDRPAQCRKDADARARQSAPAHHRGSRARARGPHDRDAHFRAGPRFPDELQATLA